MQILRPHQAGEESGPLGMRPSGVFIARSTGSRCTLTWEPPRKARAGQQGRRSPPLATEEEVRLEHLSTLSRSKILRMCTGSGEVPHETTVMVIINVLSASYAPGAWTAFAFPMRHTCLERGQVNVPETARAFLRHTPIGVRCVTASLCITRSAPHWTS